MIKNWQASAGALLLSDEDVRKARRRAVVVIGILRAVFTIIYIGTLILSGWELLVAWRSGRANDWREFWDSAWTSLRFSPFLLFWRTDVWRSISGAMQSVASARQAAVAGDDTRAPRADPQPAPPLTYSLAPGVSLGPLRQSLGTRHSSWLVMLILSILFGLIAALMGGLLASTANGDGNQTLAGLIVLGIAAFLLLLCALAIWRIVALTRPFFAEADDWGLRWREAGRRSYKKLPWHEAQAFIVLRNSATGERPRRAAYALVGREVSLAWRSTATDATSAQQAHERLAGLIVGRTKLPLRDITGDVEMAQTTEDFDPTTAPAARISTQRKDDELAARLALSQSPHTSSEIGAAPVHAAGSGFSVNAKPARPLAGCLIILIGILPSLALLGAGWGLQNYQPTYYSGLVSRVHAQAPLFIDPLKLDNGLWPIETDKEDQTSYSYQDGKYRLAGEKHDQIMRAWGTPIFNDAAVETTVARHGAGEYDGVGLLLRASENGDDYTVFYVSSDGFWWLWRHQFADDPTNEWSYIGGGRSDAIHLKDGVENRLLVIMRGSRYLCFANGQYLGDAIDDIQPLHGGHMGVYLNDSATEGMFSNYLVYPAPSTDVFA
jgi:hypothetical protein